MKIAVISDTHGVLRDEVKRYILDSDAVIHAGDIASKKLLTELSDIAANKPLYVVRGNNDRLLTELPDTLSFELGGKSFFVIHNIKEMPSDIDADVIIFGHTHKYFYESIDGTIRLNPGSCGRRRFKLPASMAIISLDNGCIDSTYIELEHGSISPAKPATIEKAAALLLDGMSIDSVCRKTEITHNDAEKIARIIVTHPGIDLRGVLDRLELGYK